MQLQPGATDRQIDEWYSASSENIDENTELKIRAMEELEEQQEFDEVLLRRMEDEQI